MTSRIRKLNNAGVTIVELIVVLAIMGVLIGGAVASYSLVNRSNIKKSSEYISECLAESRQSAMTIAADEWNVTISNSDVSVAKKVITEDESKKKVVKTDVMRKEKLPKKVEVILVDSNGITYNYDQISIVFKPLSGEVLKIYSGDGIAINIGSASYIDIISQYKSKTSSIRLYFTTGKQQRN